MKTPENTPLTPEQQRVFDGLAARVDQLIDNIDHAWRINDEKLDHALSDLPAMKAEMDQLKNSITTSSDPD